MTAHPFKLDPASNLFQEDFVLNRASFPGKELAWLESRRRAAMDAFAKTGVPSRRAEAWKYTDLSNALEAGLESAKPFDGIVPDDEVLGAVPGASLLLVNGFFSNASGTDGMDVVDLGRVGEHAPDWIRDHLGRMAAAADQPLGAVSLGLMRGGVAVRVRGTHSLRLRFVNLTREDMAVSHTRVLIVVEEGASLRLIETHSGGGSAQTFANVGTELVLKAGAKVEHVRVQAQASNALHVTSLGASLDRDAEYRALYGAFGGALSRLDIDVKLLAPGAHAVLHNLAALDAGIADVTTVMDHAAPHTTSRQLFKSVVGGRGRAVNQGRVTVRKGAIKSDSHQLFKALLLSAGAEADAKPELEIFADDVVCGHGTAIGALDSDALFYLRARGIPEKEAKGLLIRAFLQDAIEGFGGESIQDALTRRLDIALGVLEHPAP